MTDDEADEFFNESQEQLWDDMGFDSFTKSFKQWIIDNALEMSSTDERLLIGDIAEWVNESPDSYEGFFDSEGITDKIKEELKKSRDFENYIKDEYEDEEYDIDDIVEDMDFNELYEKYEEYVGYMTDYNYEVAQAYFDDFDSPWDFFKKMGYDNPNNTSVLSVDTEKVFEEIKDEDGRGGTLASYDGEEVEHSYDGVDWFIYRTN